MTAYQDLMTALVTRRPDQSAAEDDRIVQAALAKHAHELAEKQRHEHNEVGGGCELGVCHGDSLPDLIDPEVTT